MHCCRIVNVIKNKNIKNSLGKKRNLPTILHGRDAILRVRPKLLIFNIVPQLWADVKYHVPTGFGFSPKASGFLCFFVSVPPEFIHRTEKMAKCVG